MFQRFNMNKAAVPAIQMIMLPIVNRNKNT